MTTLKRDYGRLWRLFVDCVLYFGVVAVLTLIVAGVGDCGVSESRQEVSECLRFARFRLLSCIALGGVVFPFWLRRKLRRDT
jgi:hypothetical protein